MAPLVFVGKYSSFGSLGVLYVVHHCNALAIIVVAVACR